MGDARANLAYSAVQTAPSPAASGTSLTVTTGHGTRFPATPFNLVICATGEVPTPANAEIVRVTNITGDVFTITRAQEGSSARTVVVGDAVWFTATKKTFDDLDTDIAARLSNIRVSAGATSNLLSALTFSNANGVSFGLDGSTLTATVQTNYLTTAALSNHSHGNPTLNLTNLSGTTASNSAGLTLSLSANAPQTGISGIVVSDATYTSGTVSFSNQANITIASSVNGATQYIRLSGNAAQTTQTQNVHNVTLSGNTAGVMAHISSGTMTLAGGNNITVSQNGNAITISGANAGGAQTGISGVVVSNTTYTSGTVSFSNAGNITISSSVNGATQYIRLSGNAAQTTQSAIEGFGASNTGNTAGNTGLSTGIDFVLAGSNGITISQSTAAGTNTLWVSGTTYQTYDTATTVYSVASANSVGTVTRWAAEDHRHAGIGAIGISTAGNTAGNTGSVHGTYWFQGGNNITVSQITSNNGSHTLILSGANAGGAQTGISGVVVSNTTYTSGTVSFSNQANITIGSSVDGATQYIRLSGNAAQTTQSAIEGFGVSNTGNTAGNTGISTGVDWVLAGSSQITLSQSTAAGTNTVWIQHPAWISTQSTQFLALTLGGNSAGTSTFHATNNASLFFNGGNNITLSGNGSTITISAANQSNQTLGLYAVGNTTGESSSSTFDARTISFVGQGIASVGFSAGSVNISVPSGGGGLTNIRVSAGTTSNLLSAITFSNANGISFGIDASTITASANTVGTATTVYSVASANSVGTVTRWAAEDHRHAGIGAVGISTSGNTAGTTGSVLGTYWFQGGNNITVSQITSNNGSHTLVISGPPTLSQFDPDRKEPVSNSSLGQSTLYFRPVDIDGVLSASRINFFLSLTHTYSGAPANSTAWLAMGYGLYTRGTGAETDRINLLTSYSLSYVSASVSSSTRLSVTNYIGLSNATSHSTSQYGVNNASVSNYLASSIAGFRVLALPMNLTLTPGRYWLGASVQSASQGASIVLAHTVMQYHYSNNLAFRPFGAVSTASNASFYAASDGLGIYSAQSAAWPASIPLTTDAIRISTVATAPYFNISGIGTNTNLL